MMLTGEKRYEDPSTSKQYSIRIKPWANENLNSSSQIFFTCLPIIFFSCVSSAVSIIFAYFAAGKIESQRCALIYFLQDEVN